jgi:FkbM family methyltransferase
MGICIYHLPHVVQEGKAMTLRVFAKMLFDTRPHRGRSEFRFRPRFDFGRLSGIDVRAREGDFYAPIKLRPSSSDLSVFTQVFVDNDYNLRRFTRYPEICRSFNEIDRSMTPLIVDCGANIGLSSLYFAKNWPSAHILAVEPDPGNFELLRRNVAAHANIQPVHAAVGGADGPVRIMNQEAQEWARRTERVSGEAPDAVTGLSIQSLIAIAPPPQVYQPFLIKIDIEGAEKDLFSRNSEWISKFPILIIELHDWMLPGQGTSRAFLEAIAPLDRDFVYSGENIFSIANPPSVRT